MFRRDFRDFLNLSTCKYANTLSEKIAENIFMPTQDTKHVVLDSCYFHFYSQEVCLCL